MKRFIAYFDYLGFKQFIENNDLEYQIRIVKNNFRDIENALGLGKLKEARGGAVADLENSNINCINFSDTVVFWTNDDSEKSLIEILDVAYKFNWQAIGYFFPARGAIVYGDIVYVDYKQRNSAGGIYNINSVFGLGLVQAHEKAEKQHWAGTVLHQNFIEELLRRGYDLEKFLHPYAKKYTVPYKNFQVEPEEYVLNLVKGELNETAFENTSEHIKQNFSNHNKSVEPKGVQEKLANTISFLETFYEPNNMGNS